jgi:hypothetical protein
MHLICHPSCFFAIKGEVLVVVKVLSAPEAAAGAAQAVAAAVEQLSVVEQDVAQAAAIRLSGS